MLTSALVRRAGFLTLLLASVVVSAQPPPPAPFVPVIATVRPIEAPATPRMTIAGHDHLFDHWVERYRDGGKLYRRNDVLTGGGGAPNYLYAEEPDLQAYLAAGLPQQVTVEHLAKPGPQATENPHHFVIVDVDGEKISLEVVAVGGTLAPYNGRSRIDLDQ